MFRTDTPMIKRINGKYIDGRFSVTNQIKKNKSAEWQKLERWTKNQPWLANKEDFVKHVLTLPLCDFSDRYKSENEWHKWVCEDDGKIHSSDKICWPEEWAFDEFVFSFKEKLLLKTNLIEKLTGKERVNRDLKDTTYWAYISTTPAQKESFLTSIKDYRLVTKGPEEWEDESILCQKSNTVYVSLFAAYGNGANAEKYTYHWDGWFAEREGSNSTNEWRCVTSPTTQVYWNARDEQARENQGYAYDFDHLVTGLNQAAKTMLVCVTEMMSYLKYGPKHLVEVHEGKPVKKRKGGLAEKRPWLNATGPKILLLDRMPSTQKEHQGGTHASPKPHRRRGHWKTLRHPKYRHHPKYQVENGVFIKPSFVGPKEAEYEGNIYKLVEPWPDEVA